MDIPPFKDPVYITRPLLPDFNLFQKRIKQIFNSQILTNNGEQLRKFDQKLKKFLGVDNISVFCNGTLALQLAIKALNLKGQIITTPFTFPATPHSIVWNGCLPVFCDIEDKTFNINPDKIEALITEKTSAILPVHIFGNPCDVDKIEAIAKKYKLNVIYDAAHAFGVKIKKQPIGNFGDISMFSFHATKLFNTLEGGALVFKNNTLGETLNYLKNFGIKDQENVVSTGTNAKMNEIQATFGILLLEKIAHEIIKRKNLTKIYRDNLLEAEGIKLIEDQESVEHNYQYMPITINEKQYGLSRDTLYQKLLNYNIHTRKYFYPLCSQYPVYKDSMVSLPNKLLIAEKISKQILCLPLYGSLTEKNVNKICKIIKHLSNQ